MKVGLFDMVLCVSRALDLVHPAIADHHLRVAYIASCIAETLGLDATRMQNLLIAAALHDVGAISSAVRLSLLEYALQNYALLTQRPLGEGVHKHGFEGFVLTRDFPPFAAAAPLIRYHHAEWDFGAGLEIGGEPVPPDAHILHLADRVAVLPEAGGPILEQMEAMRETVAGDKGRVFAPHIVDAFLEASARESFWLDIECQDKETIVRGQFGAREIGLDLAALHELAAVLARIIDYRSPFTATHSNGVAATAEALGRHLGLSAADQTLLGVAGYLHDLGKLAVPHEILDKNAPLTPAEMRVIKRHPYFTHRVLATVPGLDTVNTWASLHHERIDGTGYPFRRRNLPLGSRIIAVADVFTAITEDRPYRRGMQRDQAIGVLERMVNEGGIDGDIVAVLRRHYDEFHLIRSVSQERVEERRAPAQHRAHHCAL